MAVGTTNRHAQNAFIISLSSHMECIVSPHSCDKEIIALDEFNNPPQI